MAGWTIRGPVRLCLRFPELGQTVRRQIRGPKISDAFAQVAQNAKRPRAGVSDCRLGLTAG